MLPPCNPRLHLNATFVKGRHAGMPLPNPTYSGVVGANLRVRPGEGEGGIEVAPGAIHIFRLKFRGAKF
ncbi:MAG: hypothetical protein DRR16_24740 [Candidatus Parabeggiatoa sp. nov. 3]|nr:MAG: hypothetical protein DRR16_24740 [Gammaproteobacteria bacterium]